MSEPRAERIRVIHIVMFAVAFGLETIGAWTATLFSVGVPGIGALWWPNGFQVAFSIWFGIWGVLAVVLGATLGGVLAGNPVVFGFALNFWIILQASIPAAGVRHLGMDAGLSRAKDWLMLIVLAFVSSLIAAVFGSAVLIAFGYVPGWFTPAFWVSYIAWGVGDALMGIIIGGILLKGLTPVIKRAGLYVEGWLY